MERDYVAITKLKQKTEGVVYFGGETPFADLKVYFCMCGKGEILHESVIASKNHVVLLECDECEKKYHPFGNLERGEFVFFRRGDYYEEI